MYGAETGLTYQVWLTPTEVQQLETDRVHGILQSAKRLQRPLVVLVTEDDPPHTVVVDGGGRGTVSIRLTRSHYQELCDEGLVSMVTGNLEVVQAYDVSRYGSPDDALRHIG